MRGQPLETFVGRIVELGMLGALLDEAAAGDPRVALLVGESGLGKTSLARQLAKVAGERGATVLHAACQEGLNVPYLPLATALRALDVRLADDPAPAPSLFEDTGATGPLRLFVEATDAIRRACQPAPVVFVVDDVQWADPATLELLAHLSASLLLSSSGVAHGVLLVLAHRPSPPTPVRRLLERLRRHPAATELHLRPFAEAEGHALVSALAGAKARPDTLARLLEGSGGNPLLLRGLVERNLADRRLVVEGRQVVIAGSVPLAAGRSDLDLDAEDRIARLSEPCRAAAGLAAFIAAEGPVSVLAAALESDPTAALAEAEAAGILTVDDGVYGFELDEVRRHLREATGARRPEVLHQRVADAIEHELGEQAPPSLLLAHLRRIPSVAPARLRIWASRAAEVAYQAGAWRDALDAYTVVLATTPKRERDAAILLRAGVAAFWANDVPVAREHLDAAVAAARDAGELTTWAEATLVTRRLSIVDASVPRHEVDLTELLEATRADPELHALSLSTAADLAHDRLDFERGFRLARAAVEADGGASQRSPLPPFSLGMLQLATYRLDDAHRSFGDAARRAEATDDHHVRTGAVSRQLLVGLLRGELPDVGDIAPGLIDDMQHRGYWSDVQLAMCVQIVDDVLAGRFARAEQGGQLVELLLDWVPYAFTAGLLLPGQAAARCRRGDVAGATRAVDRWAKLGARGTYRLQQVVDAEAGDVEAVRRQLARRPWPAPPTDANLFTAGVLAAQVQLGVLVGDADLVEPALAPLRDAVEGGVVFTTGWPCSLHRIVGSGEQTAGRVDGGIRWLELGLAATARAGARAEHALTQLALAEAEAVAGIGGATKRAADAAVLLDDLGMLPGAAGARRLAGTSRRANPPRRRVVFCSDIVGSTEMNLRAGDQAYVDEVLTEHDRILRARLATHDGVEFKHTGDGMFAWFASADDAVECAVGVHEDLERWSTSRPERPLVARIGLAEGEPVDTGVDLFGLTVVLAARLCAIAGSGRTVVADAVQRSSTTGVVSFVAAGQRRLKGFAADVSIFEVLPVASR